ncbi:hypothetical protein D9M71_337050 [compost metagenome]
MTAQYREQHDQRQQGASQPHVSAKGGGQGGAFAHRRHGFREGGHFHGLFLHSTALSDASQRWNPAKAAASS